MGISEDKRIFSLLDFGCQLGSDITFDINIEDGSPLLCSNNEMRYAGLSEREIDVVHAASRGLTNREIAELLYISTNTVQSHLKSVYDKLGIRNRTSLISHFSNKKFTSNAQ